MSSQQSPISSKDKNHSNQGRKSQIIKSFIREVQQDKIASDRLSQIVNEKIEYFEEQFQLLWNEPEDIMWENGEALEKLVTKPIYSQLMGLFDNEKDKQLEFNFKLFEFIELKHLESDDELRKHGKFQLVMQQIAKIDYYQTPREKLSCIINACKLISAIVNSTSKDNAPTGADNFLPVLIFAVLQAKPVRPFSNIGYISEFRSPSRIAGSDEYYLTAYESALEFIESLDHTKLKISAEEFKKLCSERVEGIKYDEYVGSGDAHGLDARAGEVGGAVPVRRVPELHQPADAAAQAGRGAEAGAGLLGEEAQGPVRHEAAERDRAERGGRAAPGVPERVPEPAGHRERAGGRAEVPGADAARVPAPEAQEPKEVLRAALSEQMTLSTKKAINRVTFMKSDSAATTMRLDDHQARCDTFAHLLFKGVLYSLGDTVTVLARDRSECVGKIVKILSYPQHNDAHVPLVEIQWYCLAHDLAPAFDDSRHLFSEYEIFLTNLYNVLFVDSLHRKCQVLTFDQFDSLPSVDNDVYFSRAFYSFHAQQLYPPIPDWPKACLCAQPINPDLLYIQCDQCNQWYHHHCLQQGNHPIADHFVCPVCSAKKRSRRVIH